jgi:hypothetical protein
VHSRPILESTPPETPNFWSARGHLEPVMANEQEVVRSFLQLVEVAREHDIPLKDVAEHFGRELVNVQQRVPSAFEVAQGFLVFLDLLVQSADPVDVSFAVQPAPSFVR